jgi:hypothetical protein
MQRQQIGLVTGIVLALLSGVGVIGWAQSGDTPIVIQDGSLTMQSKIPWNQFQGGGDERQHPNGGGSITSVVVTLNGVDQPAVPCTNQVCVVEVYYASTNIKVASGANGKGLRVSPFSAFQNGGSDVLVHKNQNSKISHVTVTKAGVKAFDKATTSGTKIVIHYQ